MSQATCDPRLQRLLGGEALAGLRRRLRQRFERAVAGEEPRNFRLGGLAPHEHAALASLLGRPPRTTGSLQIDMRHIDTALQQAGIADSLRDALERLDGPLVHLATLRSEQDARWHAVAGCASHPALARLLALPEGLGLLRRLSGRDPEAACGLCIRTEAVLRRLPAPGLPRAQLAAEVLGDAHALDSGQPTATLVLAAWRRFAPGTQAVLTPADENGEEDAAEAPRAERERDVWAAAGVMVNELARPALFLNLPASPGGGSLPGEPSYLSLRVLLRSPPRWAVGGREVYVCENPNLVAIAADRLGPRCAPLVCTDGMPAAAQRVLLEQLAQAGAQLRCHGDFDWAGLRIAAQVMREHGARPWRFGATDYEAAVQAAPRPGHALQGPPVAASWDAALGLAMQAHRLAIAEEAVASLLLQDLAR